ncbi:type I restriction-modification system subunit M [Atopobium fossor]|uniref:type I restriction-modification system subunit M n=1 Tax=Atopobium fossor TaxID=39487 RepID=UPI0003FC861F|nr:type I restriction-modification system subunit M [Atopobium fossor]
MNKQELSNNIWKQANKMRGKIDASEYKDFILGFIFYKFLSEREISCALANEMDKSELVELEETNIEVRELIQSELGYFINYKDLFSTWISSGYDFEIANVYDALSAFNRNIVPSHKKVFEKIFDSLETGLSKLGTSASAQTKSARDIMQLINKIPMDGKQGYDVLGYIYEDLISKFASTAGKKAGEFYTPHEVSTVMANIVAYYLRNKDSVEVYDPTSGSGSLLITIGKAAAQYSGTLNSIKFYAQELNQNTYNLTRMNLIMRGIAPDNLYTRNADTLDDDWPYFDENDPSGTYNPLFVNAVVSNPPYSQDWHSENKENDPRYSFGLAPKSTADYAFLLHDLYHLQPDGVMTIVLPHGVLFRGGSEGEIRRNLLENHHIEAVIGLPANIFFGTGIPTIIMVLRKQRVADNVLFIDASKGFEKKGTQNVLRACDIKRITDTIIAHETVEGYSRVVPLEEIRNNDYNLNIPRYIDTSEKAESWDIYASMFGGIPNSEIDALKDYWDAFSGLRETLFTSLNEKYSKASLDTSDAFALEDKITNYAKVKDYEAVYKSKLSGIQQILQESLINNLMSIEPNVEKNSISDALFTMLDGIPLVDKYDVYQVFAAVWEHVEQDIEVIHADGFESIKTVEPNMVTKTKGGEEVDVQEGWKGHIFPYEFVQQRYLKDDLARLTALTQRLDEINSERNDIFESLSEEEKSHDVVNDSSTAFVTAAIKKYAKEFKKDFIEEDSFEEKIINVSALANEETTLKRTIKEMNALLEANTRKQIENLTDDQIYILLKDKWITPIIDGVFELPQVVITDLSKKVSGLCKKYATTLSDLQQEINTAEAELIGSLDQLVGDEYDMLGLEQFKKLLGGE